MKDLDGKVSREDFVAQKDPLVARVYELRDVEIALHQKYNHMMKITQQMKIYANGIGGDLSEDQMIEAMIERIELYVVFGETGRDHLQVSGFHT